MASEDQGSLKDRHVDSTDSRKGDSVGKREVVGSA